MAKTALYNMEGKAIGEVELSDEIFAAPINEAAMHLMVRSYLAAQRQGTQSAPERPDPRRSPRRRPEDLPPEGHRQRPAPWQPRTAVQARRRGVRPQAP